MTTVKKIEEEVKDSRSNFKDLLAEYFKNIPNIGDVVKGKVIGIDKGEVHVDIESVTTGVVRGPELFAESHEYSSLKVGDEVEATVVDLENENGEMELSFRIAGFQRAWNKMKKIMKDGLTIKAKVLSANKGGLMIKVDALMSFMPVSQLSPEHYPRVTGGDKNRILDKLQEIIGHDLEVKIIDVDEKEEKLIVSERAVWEDAQKAVLESYKVGDTVERKAFARKLVELQFNRTNSDLKRGTYRLRGENWEIMPADREVIYNFEVQDSVIRAIYEIDPVKGFQAGKTPQVADVVFAPAKHFITSEDERIRAIEDIKLELEEHEITSLYLEAVKSG